MSERRTEFGQCLRCLIEDDDGVKRVCSLTGICAECARTANASFAVDLRAAIANGEKPGKADSWASESYGPVEAG